MDPISTIQILLNKIKTVQYPASLVGYLGYSHSEELHYYDEISKIVDERKKTLRQNIQALNPDMNGGKKNKTRKQRKYKH